MSTETRLRAELRAWAGELDPDAGPDVSAASFTELRARRLRHRAALLAAAVAVVVATVAVPLLVSREDPRPAPAAPASLFDLPTRGPLAGDAAFLAAAVRLPWGAGDPDPPVPTRHVVWAGDVPGGQRWVLVAGENSAVPRDPAPDHQTDLGAVSPVALALFSGPAGAPGDQLALRSIPRGQTADEPFAVVDPTTGSLLVVAAPGDAVEVSERPVFEADGTESRSWTAAAAPDGVASLQVGPRAGEAVVYRVLREGREVMGTRGPDVLGEPAPPADLSLATVHGPLTVPHDAQQVARALVARTGLDQGDPDALIAWQGEIPGDGGAAATATVAAVTVPSGAVLVDVLWTRFLDDGSGYGSTCGPWGQLVMPAGLPAAERTYAFACTVTDAQGGNPVRSFVVAAPPSAVLARMYDGSGAQVAEATLTDGVVVLPDSGTVGQRAAAQVEAFTADGTSLGRTPVLGG